MKRFREEKLEIFDCPNFIIIEAFNPSLLNNYNLFVKLRKKIPHTLEEVYGEVRKNFNLQRELGLIKERKNEDKS